MEFAIIISKSDPAGMNIKLNLIEKCGFEKTKEYFEGDSVYTKNNMRLYTLDKEHLYYDNLDKIISAEIFIYATIHRSESKMKSFCVHSPGNWSIAVHGGKSKSLCFAPAKLNACLLRRLEKNSIDGFEVVEEVTHHGPYMEKPAVFIEIGSTENEWKDKNAGNVIAKTIIEGIDDLEKDCSTFAFGIGGPHYAPNFKKLVIEYNFAFGHICPKYNIINLDENMILQAIEKTYPKCELVVIDWKGTGPENERNRIISLLEKNSIRYQRIDQIRK